MTAFVIRNAEVDGTPGIDIRLSSGRIEDVGVAVPTSGAVDVIDARGGAVIPGLHDHHLHLHAMAAHAASVLCGPPAVHDRAALADALAAAPGDEHNWVRGVGYTESVAGDLDASTLDRLHAARPVRIQHRSGALWVFNTAALTSSGLVHAAHPGLERGADGRPTGRIWRGDTWLREHLPGSQIPRLHTVGAVLARYGITSVTDASPDMHPRSHAAIAAAAVDGDLPQRVHLLGAPLEDVRPTNTDRITVGPHKIVIGDAGLPELDDLIDRIRIAHRHGRAVAVHCVSREALLLVLAALDTTGARPGDRIEHGALIPPETIAHLRRHKLRVITQPGFLAHRGDDYLRDVDEVDLPDLYRCRTLTEAGIPVAVSSDAPYGPLDPWAVITAAATRATGSGVTIGAAECITAQQAIDGYLTPADDPGGHPRRIHPGATADLVLLHTSLKMALRAPTADNVRLIVIDGLPV